MTRVKLREEIIGNAFGKKIVRIDTLASEEDAILQSVRNFLVGFEICSLE